MLSLIYVYYNVYMYIDVYRFNLISLNSKYVLFVFVHQKISVIYGEYMLWDAKSLPVTVA